MRTFMLVLGAAAVLAAPAVAADTKPKTERAAPHYDCTKKGNANKAACKTAAATATTPAATPAPAKAAPPAPMAAAKPAPAAVPAPAPAAAKGGSMAACAKQWDSFTPAQKDAYKAQAQGKLSAKGNKLNGYTLFTSECLKKK